MASKRMKRIRRGVRRAAAVGLVTATTVAGATLGGGAGATTGALVGGQLGARVAGGSKKHRAEFRERSRILSAAAGVATTGASLLGAFGKERQDPLRAAFGKLPDLFGGTGSKGQEAEGEETSAGAGGSAIVGYDPTGNPIYRGDPRASDGKTPIFSTLAELAKNFTGADKSDAVPSKQGGETTNTGYTGDGTGETTTEETPEEKKKRLWLWWGGLALVAAGVAYVALRK